MILDYRVNATWCKQIMQMPIICSLFTSVTSINTFFLGWMKFKHNKCKDFRIIISVYYLFYWLSIFCYLILYYFYRNWPYFYSCLRGTSNIIMNIVFMWNTYAAIIPACLPFCCANAACSFIINTEQCVAAVAHCRVALLPSRIKVNCMHSAAVGKAAKLTSYWQDAAYRLVIPKRQVKFAHLHKYLYQSGKTAVGKLVWKKHNSLIDLLMYPYMALGIMLIISRNMTYQACQVSRTFPQ